MGSADSIGALRTIVSELPSHFPAPILVSVHRGRDSALVNVLARGSQLKLREPEEGEKLVTGAVYVASGGRHITLNQAKEVVLYDGPRQGGRPSADRLLESLANHAGRAVAVILSGAGSDGASGATAIHAAGGVVIVQDRSTSEYYDMPCRAIERQCVDMILRIENIGFAIATLFLGLDAALERARSAMSVRGGPTCCCIRRAATASRSENGAACR